MIRLSAAESGENRHFASSVVSELTAEGISSGYVRSVTRRERNLKMPSVVCSVPLGVIMVAVLVEYEQRRDQPTESSDFDRSQASERQREV